MCFINFPQKRLLLLSANSGLRFSHSDLNLLSSSAPHMILFNVLNKTPHFIENSLSVIQSYLRHLRRRLLLLFWVAHWGAYLGAHC